MSQYVAAGLELTSVIAINVLEERRLQGIAARRKVFAGSRKNVRLLKTPLQSEWAGIYSLKFREVH